MFPVAHAHCFLATKFAHICFKMCVSGKKNKINMLQNDFSK